MDFYKSNYSERNYKTKMKFHLAKNKTNKDIYLGESTTATVQDETTAGSKTGMSEAEMFRLIEEEFDRMKSDEIISLLNIPNKTNIDSNSPMFILPNGIIASVSEVADLNGLNLPDAIHSDMIYVIFKAIGKKLGIDYNDVEHECEEVEQLYFLTEYKGWARVNCGMTWTEPRFYCVLPRKMTSSQYSSLEKWLEWGYDTNKKNVIVMAPDDSNTYSYSQDLPEDIIKKIKRYYSSGKLYESISEVDSNGNSLTPEQVAFFKDSKIRNFNDKKLLVCYHATNADFTAFDKSFIGSGSGGVFGSGFYFTTHSDTAKSYGSKLGSYYLNITNPYDYYNMDKDALVDLLDKSGYEYDKEFVDNFDYDNWDADLIDDFLVDALINAKAYDVVSEMIQRAGYDGIWAGSEIIAFEPNQIKSITNTNPTNSNNINEDIWNKEGTVYQPKQDSRYKRLIRKPINTLTQEEIKYIFTIHWCWYLANVRRFDYIEDALENTTERFSEEYFKECYDFLHSLSFPLKVYRAIRDSEHSDDGFTISGKNASYSWSTNINIYKDTTSKFRNCTKIVSCEIDSNVIDVANTINNFIFYTSSHHTRGYGEYEITLKQYFSQGALKNLQWIDKNNINEKIDHITVDEESSDYDELFVVDTVRELKEFMNKTHWIEYRVIDSTNYGGRYYIGDSMNHIHSQILNAVVDNGWFPGENRMTIQNKFYDTDFVIICPGEDNDNGVFGTDGYCVKYIFNDYTILARDYIDNTELIQKFGKLIDVIDIAETELYEHYNINESYLTESLHKLGSDCFITDSPYDIKNLIMNKPKLYRILYDSNIDMYMIGDGNEVIHWDMITEARRQGYYANQEDFIDELGGTLDNYVETGIYGIYDDDYEVDPYLLYMVFSPDNEEFMLGEDGYDGQLKFNFGYLFLREADQGVMDNCDLIKILQKLSWINESMNYENGMKETMDITNEVQRAVDNIMKNKSKYRNQNDLEDTIYSAVANCFSGMHGVTRDTADMIADVYEKELKRVGLNSINEDVTNDDYCVIKSDKMYDPSGFNDPLDAKVIFTGSEDVCLNKLNNLKAKFSTRDNAIIENETKNSFTVYWHRATAKDTYTVTKLPENANYDLWADEDYCKKVLATPDDYNDREIVTAYCRLHNIGSALVTNSLRTQILNKYRNGLKESNELEQRAKKHKKKSKGMGWHMAVNAGDVEKGIEVFNNATSCDSCGGESTAMGEDIEKKQYKYKGSIDGNSRTICPYCEKVVTAKNKKEAARKILKKFPGAISLDMSRLVEVDKVDESNNKNDDKPNTKKATNPKPKKCDKCNTRLNDADECPYCDLGDEDIDEGISKLEAIWYLNRLD